MPKESQLNAIPVKITQGKIEFQNVSFRYGENNPWVLKNINLIIEAKQTIAIKGSGLGGKSTLLSLIAGLHQCSSGKILIDGHNIATANLQILREQIGYMPQKASLFNGTLLENLTLFEDKYSERAMEIAKQVGLRDFIEHLEEGYNTPVADRNGETIPRGIVQRIMIARALIRRPPIVLFDEANIAIDMQGDHYIKKLLEQLHRQCTLILVSHRPSILQFADQCYLLENSELREHV
jgi:ATP-binding cassette subfamily C protein LapB